MSKQKINSDADFLLNQWRELVTQFKEDYDKWEKHTLGDYVSRCAEIINNQIEAKMIEIPTHSISSYLYKELNKEGIEVSDRYIQKVLPDDFKRNYIKSEQSSDIDTPKWETIETENPDVVIEKDQFNHFKINGEEVKKKEPRPVRSFEPSSTPTQNKATDQFKYLSALSKLANKMHLTCETVKARYNESDEIQAIMDKELGDVNAKLQEYAKTWATIENAKGMIDLRRDWGEYEKIMGTFMIETGETIARIAKIMDYSEKYGSIGLLREPKVREFFEDPETYPKYLRSCPKCYADIASTMNKNISLYRECKDLKIDIPVIKFKHENK